MSTHLSMVVVETVVYAAAGGGGGRNDGSVNLIRVERRWRTRFLSARVISLGWQFCRVDRK